MSEEHEELRQCLERFAELKADFDAIIAIFGKDTVLTGERKMLAQERLRALKSRLEREVSAGENELSQAEKAFYFRGVLQAKTSIHVRYNSKPDQKWIDQLLTARSSLALAASRAEQALQRVLEGKS